VVVLEILLTFTVLGLLGGLAMALLIAKTWREFASYATVRRVAIGAIVGFLYYFLWSEWTYPNCVMAFISGMWGVDFLERLRERFRPSGSGDVP